MQILVPNHRGPGIHSFCNQTLLDLQDAGQPQLWDTKQLGIKSIKLLPGEQLDRPALGARATREERAEDEVREQLCLQFRQLQ